MAALVDGVWYPVQWNYIARGIMTASVNHKSHQGSEGKLAVTGFTLLPILKDSLTITMPRKQQRVYFQAAGDQG